MATNVKLLKLLTGEDLIAEVKDQFTNPIEIKNPLRIIVMPNKVDPKTPSIGFAPWAEFSDEKVFYLDKSHVVVIMEPIDEFVKQYTRMFGGLVLPKSGLILPGA